LSISKNNYNYSAQHLSRLLCLRFRHCRHNRSRKREAVPLSFK